MSKIRKGAIRPLIIVITSVLLLTACLQEWYVSIVDVEDPLNPQFCVSENHGCSGGGIKITEFFVAAVDDTGRYTDDGGIMELMWIIQPEKDVTLHRLTYGSVPAGWRETSTSKPLKIGRWYTVGTHYFRFERVGNEIQVEMLNSEEFRNYFYPK